MTERMGSVIINMVQTVIFLTPLLAVFYRQGKKDQALEELKKDLDGLGKKVSSERDGLATAMTELKAQIDNVNNTLVRVTTEIKYISKSVEEIKKK